MLDEPLVGRPERGRVFQARRRVRLADASPSQRLRLDACARYLQDVGNDDTAESGLDDDAGLGAGIWVVRRALVDLAVPPRWGEQLDLATWCSGTGRRWAGRRLSIIGDQGGQVELDTLWIHLDRETLRPTRLPDVFVELYGEAAQGRHISSRQWLDRPTDGDEADDTNVERLAWPLRYTDFDVMGHVNNAAYWAAVEEVLASRPEHPVHPRHGQPVRAVLEFGAGIGRDARVDLLVASTDKRLDVWFQADGQTSAAARLLRRD